jgi:putative cardiolipin synthase
MMDQSRMYIGALNISPRGQELNTENGLLIRNPAIAGQLAAVVARDLKPENAWRVQQDKRGRLYWESSAGKVTRQPADNGWQRFADWFFGLFPLENQI